MKWQDYVLNGGTEADRAAAERDHAAMVGEPTDALVSEAREALRTAFRETNTGALVYRLLDAIDHLTRELWNAKLNSAQWEISYKRMAEQFSRACQERDESRDAYLSTKAALSAARAELAGVQARVTGVQMALESAANNRPGTELGGWLYRYAKNLQVALKEAPHV